MKVNAHRNLLLAALGLVLLVAFWMPAPGNAQGIIFGDRISGGQVLDHNMILNGTDVSIDGTVNGDVLAIGRTVSINGAVNGTLLAIGETIVINGVVSNTVFAGGVMMELAPTGKIGRDLYFAGARLMLPGGSAVQRDLYLLGLEAQLTGEIRRDIHATIGPLQIVELILVPLKDRISIIGAIQPETIGLAKAPRLAGIGAGVLASTSSWLAGGQRTAQQTSTIDVDRLNAWGVSLLRNLVALLVLGLLCIWLVPAPINWASEKIQQAPIRMAFLGLSSFLGGWFVAILALILVVMLALFFYSLSLPNLGFVLGALGLTGVGLGASAFWISITYISKIIVAVLIGRLLLQRFAPRYVQSNLWPLVLGTVLYVLVASIPYLGWVIATLVTIFGLGALWAVSFPLFPQEEEMVDLPTLAQTD